MGQKSLSPTGCGPGTPEKPTLWIDCESIWNSSPTPSHYRHETKRISSTEEEVAPSVADEEAEGAVTGPVPCTGVPSVLAERRQASDIYSVKPDCQHLYEYSELPGLASNALAILDNDTQPGSSSGDGPTAELNGLDTEHGSPKPKSRFLRENIIPRATDSNKLCSPANRSKEIDRPITSRRIRMLQLLEDSYPDTDTEPYPNHGPWSCSIWAKSVACSFKREQKSALHKYSCNIPRSRIYGAEKEHNFVYTATSKPAMGYVMPPPYYSHSDSPLYSPVPRRMRALGIDMTGLYY